jgi:hypothetical protein
MRMPVTDEKIDEARTEFLGPHDRPNLFAFGAAASSSYVIADD